MLEKERVDDREDPAVHEVHHDPDELRPVAIRGEHRADDERHVDAGEAERLAGDRQRGQHDRGRETPEKNRFEVHRLLSIE